MIPVLGFCTLARFDLADRLLASIDYPVRDLVIIDNSGKKQWQPQKPDSVERMWFMQVPNGLGLVGAWNLIVKTTPFAPFWLLVNDDAWFEPGALQAIAENADPGALSFVKINTSWSCIALGEAAVQAAGLYDERFYPLYFDDNDYERRIRNAGIPVKTIAARVHHDNSSTLAAGYQAANSKTFAANQRLFEQKVASGDYSQGVWDLGIRRANNWA